MKFSIIIPAYGAEKSIEKCLSSVCNQAFPKDNFEVIVVDDCSPDNQNSLIENLTKKFSNLTLVKHQVNKRQGGARNTGLRVAKGDYIIFLDSDDYWCYDTVLKRFDKALSETKADIMLSSNVLIECNTPICERFMRDDFGTDLILKYTTSEDWILDGSMIGSIVMGAYKRELIENNKIYFRENVTSEDSDWNCKTLVYTNKIAIIDFPFYVYVTNMLSTTHTYKLSTLTNGIDCDSIILRFFNETKRVSNLFKYKWAKKQSKDIFNCFIMKTRHYPIRLSIRAFDYFRESSLLDLSQYPPSFEIKCRILGAKYLGLPIILLLRGLYLLRDFLRY
jgi:glycosyltransferase involved in cell wall biosynthesis